MQTRTFKDSTVLKLLHSKREQYSCFAKHQPLLLNAAVTPLNPYFQRIRLSNLH